MIAVIIRQGAAKRDTTFGGYPGGLTYGRRDRDICAARRENDSVEGCVPPVDLRIVRPRVSLAHDRVHGIVAYALSAVVADVGALSIRWLPGLAAKIAVLKGADAR